MLLQFDWIGASASQNLQLLKNLGEMSECESYKSWTPLAHAVCRSIDRVVIVVGVNEDRIATSALVTDDNPLIMPVSLATFGDDAITLLHGIQLGNWR